ncbi:acylneuraminate cytidylyltransferase family protein [Galenea microaerophila]
MSQSQAKVTALIPARGGSKGIPKKNLFPIMAKPLLQYTFEAAQASKYLTNIMLSTEDEEILHFANLHNIDTRYRRPTHLSSDQAQTNDVVKDFLMWLQLQGEMPDILVLLQPTSPLRSAEDIDRAITQFQENHLDSLVSVHKMTEHPYKSLEVSADGQWHFLAKPEKDTTRRQDYDDRFYTINGALYLVKPEWFLQEGRLVVEGKTQLFEMNPISGMDVDELVDVFKVEAYLKMLA